MTRKSKLMVLSALIIVAAVAIASLSYSLMVNRGDEKPNEALRQNILEVIEQNGGDIVYSNGSPVIYKPNDFYITVWDDESYRHIGLWVDGVLFVDRQLMLDNSQESDNMLP